MNVKGFNRCDECRRSGVELNFAGTQLLCEPCASGNGSTCSAVLADHTIKREEENYHQDQDQDQDQAPFLRDDVPGPGGNPEPGLLDVALDEYRRGNLTPVEVELPVPRGAGAVMRAVAEHMRLLIGLRLALGDDRPLPYAASMPVRAGITDDKGTASKAIRALVDLGVIHYVGSLPRTAFAVRRGSELSRGLSHGPRTPLYRAELVRTACSA